MHSVRLTSGSHVGEGCDFSSQPSPTAVLRPGRLWRVHSSCQGPSMAFVRFIATSTCPVADRYQDVRVRGRSHIDIGLALGRSTRCVCTRYIIVRILIFGKSQVSFPASLARGSERLVYRDTGVTPAQLSLSHMCSGRLRRGLRGAASSLYFQTRAYGDLAE